MPHRETEQLRVFVVNEPTEQLALVVEIIVGLGHEVIACDTEVAAAGAMVAKEHSDVAVVGIGGGSDHALLLVERIARDGACPVVVHGDAPAATFAKEASRRGMFAHVRHGKPEEWRSAFEIAVCRFAQYRDLEEAFARRAITERAKGILMERHQIDERQAFALLRDQARMTNRKLVDIAAAVLEGHRLLPGVEHQRHEDLGAALQRQRKIAAANSSSRPPGLTSGS